MLAAIITQLRLSKSIKRAGESIWTRSWILLSCTPVLLLLRKCSIYQFGARCPTASSLNHEMLSKDRGRLIWRPKRIFRKGFLCHHLVLWGTMQSTLLLLHIGKTGVFQTINLICSGESGNIIVHALWAIFLWNSTLDFVDRGMLSTQRKGKHRELKSYWNWMGLGERKGCLLKVMLYTKTWSRNPWTLWGLLLHAALQQYFLLDANPVYKCWAQTRSQKKDTKHLLKPWPKAPVNVFASVDWVTKEV